MTSSDIKMIQEACAREAEKVIGKSDSTPLFSYAEYVHFWRSLYQLAVMNEGNTKEIR